jgi:hypothetical protein
VGGDVPVESETLLVTDFVNLQIKSTQSFRCAYRNIRCIYVFIEMSNIIYISTYIYTVAQKKIIPDCRCKPICNLTSRRAETSMFLLPRTAYSVPHLLGRLVRVSAGTKVFNNTPPNSWPCPFPSVQKLAGGPDPPTPDSTPPGL